MRAMITRAALLLLAALVAGPVAVAAPEQPDASVSGPPRRRWCRTLPIS